MPTSFPLAKMRFRVAEVCLWVSKMRILGP